MMRLSTLCILVMVLMLSTGNAWCQETETAALTDATGETVDVAVPSIDVVDTMGIGTEGYGSPVRSDRIVSGEVFSARSGYVHPFLSVGGFYTDNLFQTNESKKSDKVAIITPGIWFALPAMRQQLIEIETMNTAPGGLALNRIRRESTRRFQGYALYRADIRIHDKYSDDDRTDHRAEGSFKVNLRGGLSLEMLDVYEINRDPYGTGGTRDRKLDKFDANLYKTILAYQFTPKTSLRLDYGNYYLDYNKDQNQYRNRTDNTVSAFLFYDLTPKTSVFVQAEYISIDYDEDINSDSDVMNYFIGAQMKTSKKLRGRVKVGYGGLDYDDDNLDDRNELLAEARLDYFFTPKTSIYLRGSRGLLVSDSFGTNSILSYRTQFGYRQRFTPKLRGEMAFNYANNDYKDNILVGIEADKRKDKVYGFVAAVGFTVTRWLNASVGYEYEERDSTFDGNDFTSNTGFLRLTAAL